MSNTEIIPLNRGDGMTLTASSAVVIDDVTTLVDPGSVGNIDQVEASLKNKGLKWEDIHQIYFTHLHFDHYDLLEDIASIERIYMPRKEVEYIRSLMSHKNDLDEYKAHLSSSHERIAKPFIRQFVHYRFDKRYEQEYLRENNTITHFDGVTQISKHCKSIPLPGHCCGLHGLEVETANGIGIIASDAVLNEQDWLGESIEKHLIIHDSARFVETRKNLEQYDWILPGHGQLFTNVKRCETTLRESYV